jgi:glycosyltransferase involved in cell wall biosynthesis
MFCSGRGTGECRRSNLSRGLPMHITPTVSIGLPVRNGAHYVAEAIESILAQTFADFELIISDNASSDATASICESYAARDRRIRCYRHPHNLGASYNFNFVFRRATGAHFKWAAHDDVIRPTFLERTLAALEADPEAVLCQSLVQVVDRHNRVSEIYDHTAFGTDLGCVKTRDQRRLNAVRRDDGAESARATGFAGFRGPKGRWPSRWRQRAREDDVWGQRPTPASRRSAVQCPGCSSRG